MFRYRLLLCCTLASMLVLPSDTSAADAPDQAVQPVRLCVDPDWPPYEILNSKGDYQGIAADLLQLIFERAELEYEVVPVRHWDESLAKARAGECDALSLLNQTDERDQWLIFTRPYFVDPNVIIARADHPYVRNLSSLAGSRIALPTGTSVAERIQRDFPQLQIIPVASEIEAFDLVDKQQAELTLRSLTVAAWTIREEGWFNLRIAGEVPEYENRLRIGILKHRPELRSQLDAAVATLTDAEVDAIINQHIAIEVNRYDYGLIIQVLAAAIAIIGLLGALWWRQRRIGQKLLHLKHQLERNIEDKTAAEALLRESEFFFRSLIETAHEGIAVIQEGRVVYANPRFAELTGYSLEELRALDSFIILIAPEDRDQTHGNYRRRLEGQPVEQHYEIELLRRDGIRLPVEVSGARINWYGKAATLSFISDITLRREAEARFRHMAHHDPLTNLPNRNLLLERLEQNIARAERYQQHLSLLYFDLDGFKPVNDKWGHETGDHLLQAIAARLLPLLRSADTLARIGGDEFVVLLPETVEAEDVQTVSAKLMAKLNEPFELGKATVQISASIGTARFPEDGITASELLQVADRAMYEQKRKV
ncbi:diguanylate cyclase [Marinobacterium sp. MBR-109]|jgi:diguanylate cyclase (GGDEF)-like protein/PAS domain S-box-containing protein|uniref:diguanylate cyclase domain-containing protein n=1 Tax=Marinobacterium sp. MBR-109 TaxID=3156462 RepID=UPI003398A4A6